MSPALTAAEDASTTPSDTLAPLPGTPTESDRPSALPLRYVEVEHVLEVLDPSSTTFKSTNRYRFEALRPFRFFERRYRWTGAGMERSPELLDSQDAQTGTRKSVHGPVVHDGEGRIVLVDLGRDLVPGEIDEVTLVQVFVDTEEQFEPFNRLGVRDPVERGILRVRLPRQVQTNVRQVERDILSGRPVAPMKVLAPDEVDDLPDGVAQFSLEIESPTVGRSYAIHWT